MSVHHTPRLLTILLLIGQLLPAQAQDLADQPLERIGLGSCIVQDQPQPIWGAVLADDPQLFLLTGDNIYADTEDMDVMRAKYARLAANPGYQELVRTTPVLATWDDHDYGANDVGHWYPRKQESEQIFLDFFDVPADSPRRQRPGIYGAHIFGPPGRRVQVILLDTRYFRSRFGRSDLRDVMYERGFGPYGPNRDPKATMLGEDQWAWLEEQLEEPAEIRLIVSSIQVVSAEHGWEIWSQLPHEKQRLYDLIAEKQAGGVIFLSGDVHWGEVSRYDAGPYPLYDLTSSAINQEWPGALNLPNAQRMSRSVYPYPNYGLVEIDWDREDPLITLRVNDENGDTVFAHPVRLSTLQP